MHVSPLVHSSVDLRSLEYVSDARLMRDLRSLIVDERAHTALLLAHIGEVDARRLYVEAGFASMFIYCIEELHLSEGAAYRRITIARASRRFPTLLSAIVDGRLHLAAATALVPYMTNDNCDDLIRAATHRKKAEVEAMLASRFPSQSPPPAATIRTIPGRTPTQPQPKVDDELFLGRVQETVSDGQLFPGRVEETKDDTALFPGRVEPPSPVCYRVQVSISASTHEKLRKAQALLGHVDPSGDVAQVLDRALDALIEQLEKRKCGKRQAREVASREVVAREVPTQEAAAPAQASRCEQENPMRAKARYIPPHVRRAVWERDGGQCTYVGPAGNRCSAKHLLEFDHVQPLARGGRATVEGLRLRCRTHNQYTANEAFGVDFMNEKRRRGRMPT